MAHRARNRKQKQMGQEVQERKQKTEQEIGQGAENRVNQAGERGCLGTRLTCSMPGKMLGPTGQPHEFSLEWSKSSIVRSEVCLLGKV